MTTVYYIYTEGYKEEWNYIYNLETFKLQCKIKGRLLESLYFTKSNLILMSNENLVVLFDFVKNKIVKQISRDVADNYPFYENMCRKQIINGILIAYSSKVLYLKKLKTDFYFKIENKDFVGWKFLDEFIVGFDEMGSSVCVYDNILLTERFSTALEYRMENDIFEISNDMNWLIYQTDCNRGYCLVILFKFVFKTKIIFCRYIYCFWFIDNNTVCVVDSDDQVHLILLKESGCEPYMIRGSRNKKKFLNIKWYQNFIITELGIVYKIEKRKLIKVTKLMLGYTNNEITKHDEFIKDC